MCGLPFRHATRQNRSTARLAQQPKALALAGAAALQAGNPQAARDHWQALLALLEPGSDVALQVQDDLVKLELLLREPAAAPAQPPAR